MSAIEYENGYIKLDLAYLYQAMSEEDQKTFIKSLAVESNIIGHVVDYICGDDPDGWWTGKAGDHRHEILTRIERTQTEKWTRYHWSAFDEIVIELKNIRCKQQIYWKLYHNEAWGDVLVKDEDTDKYRPLETLIQDWLRKRGIESNYTTKEANADIERIENLVKEKLDVVWEENDTIKT